MPRGALGTGTGAVPGPFPGRSGGARGSARPRAQGEAAVWLRPGRCAGVRRGLRGLPGPEPLLSPIAGVRRRGPAGSGTGGRSEPGIDAGAATGRDARGQRRRASVGHRFPRHPSIHPCTGGGSLRSGRPGSGARHALDPQSAHTAPSPPVAPGPRPGSRPGHPRSAAPGPERCPRSHGPARPAPPLDSLEGTLGNSSSAGGRGERRHQRARPRARPPPVPCPEITGRSCRGLRCSRVTGREEAPAGPADNGGNNKNTGKKRR